MMRLMIRHIFAYLHRNSADLWLKSHTCLTQDDTPNQEANVRNVEGLFLLLPSLIDPIQVFTGKRHRTVVVPVDSDCWVVSVVSASVISCSTVRTASLPKFTSSTSSFSIVIAT
jgi:hypothetical protein